MDKKEKAIRAKAKWLNSCLEFGWSKNDLDGLAALWDKFKDEDGNLRAIPADTPSPDRYREALEWIDVKDQQPDAYRKEGKKKFINWVLGTNCKTQFVCVYTKGHELEYGDNDPQDSEYDEVEERNGCLYLKPGWYELEDTPGGEYDETWVSREPTHWQPLPALPIARAALGEKEVGG